MLIKEVSPGLFRGPFPDIKDISGLKKAGINEILCLREMSPEEKEECKANQIFLINEPWSEVFPPTPRQMTDAACWANMVNPESQLLICCKHGVDRTGAAVFAHRVRNQKWAFDAAYGEMLNMGHNVLFYWWWKKRLKHYSDLQSKGNKSA